MEQFKGRLLDGFKYSLIYAKNPFYFAPFPIDWFEEYNEERRTPDFKLLWSIRNKYLILFWVLLVLEVILIYLVTQRDAGITQ